MLYSSPSSKASELTTKTLLAAAVRASLAVVAALSSSSSRSQPDIGRTNIAMISKYAINEKFLFN